MLLVLVLGNTNYIFLVNELGSAHSLSLPAALTTIIIIIIAALLRWSRATHNRIVSHTLFLFVRRSSYQLVRYYYYYEYYE